MSPTIGPFADRDFQHIATSPATVLVEEHLKSSRIATPTSTATWGVRLKVKLMPDLSSG